MKHIIVILTFLSTTLWAQIPTDYYDNASGLIGAPLHQALHDIIDDHTVVSYSSLWTHYQTTDVKPNGTVWDMYSDVPGGTPAYEFTFGEDQDHGTGGGSEGEFYNREHSWPKSWFNDQSPMNTDIFHVVPTDKFVNNRRGSYPYGEVSSPTWTSTNGSKLGPYAYSEYSGTVFEPIDAYKGDFARIYFYMSTRYLNEDGNWPGSPMVDGAQLEQWALDMMMEWHMQDPVSQKEIDRNDDIYNFVQSNRNPFVDHPNYVDLIWGDPPALPLAPSNLQADNITSISAELNWTDNADNEDGYYLYQSGSHVATLPSGATYVLVENLSALQTYNYSVSCYNSTGESDTSSHTFTTMAGGDTTVAHFTEDFESASGSSYFEGDLPLSSGVWNASQAGNFTLGIPRSGTQCLTINDDAQGAHITTPAVNTLGTVSFYYYQRNGAPSDQFQVLKFSNGSGFELVSTQNYNVGENYTLFSVEVNDTSSSVRIQIVNDNQAGHLIIDDFTVTQYDPVSIDETVQVIPANLTLSPAYPNPFNPEVTLSFQLTEDTEFIRIQVYDIQGELIATPFQGNAIVGTYSVTWDGTNQRGESLPSGMYIVKLSTPRESRFQRVTLLR
ncbi:MAG: T9SS type A sorting domain-containing protein [Candidatus Marinimicrobia bacterium]|nr:T9SS type A sorting domain-containing protein [Candidatus Neomarinimicrobiota bacterium]MBT5465063.1 T9SS type A sorting domain-containing protein [Candidatus Neomarinimicrobiota bacterium]